MEKIDINKLGEQVIDYRDGKPFTSTVNPVKASKEVAEKVNEIIDYLNFIEHKLGNQSNMAEFNQLKQR